MNNINAVLPYVKLNFNIANPNYEESYSLGYQNAMHNAVETDNPFKEGTQAFEQWLEGWWDCTSGEEPLFDIKQYFDSEELIDKENSANDRYFYQKQSLLSLCLEISGALAASAIVGYQLFELVA